MRKITILLVSIFIILLGLLISLNYYLSKKALLEEAKPTPKVQEVTPEVPKITLPKVIYNLAGTIKKIEKESFILEASVPQLDESSQPIQKNEIRKVIISPTTKFSRLTFVPQEGTDRRVPKETSITLKDLKLGDYIEVISNQDISQREEFEATQIRVLPKSF